MALVSLKITLSLRYISVSTTNQPRLKRRRAPQRWEERRTSGRGGAPSSSGALLGVTASPSKLCPDRYHGTGDLGTSPAVIGPAILVLVL